MEPKILILDIVGYEGRYQIYSDGRVYSSVSKRFLKPYRNSNGYPVVKITKKHSGKHPSATTLHRLLAEHFIPNPDKLETVNHIDGDKWNWSLDNLEWMSREDNVKHGLQKIYKAVSPEGVVHEFIGQTEFCRERNLTQPNFSKMLSGERATCKGWRRAA